MAATALVRRPIDLLAREAGVHPDLARRLVALGLVDDQAPYPADAAARLARAVRLRRDLGLDYSAAVLVCELLARIDDLEARLARYEPRPLPEVMAWIRTS